MAGAAIRKLTRSRALPDNGLETRSLLALPAVSTTTRLSIAVGARQQRVQDDPVRLEHVLELAGVLPPPLDHVRPDQEALIDQPLDGVGDLELAPGRGRDRLHRLEHRRVEHVDADEPEVRRRLLRFLDQTHHLPVAQHRHPGAGPVGALA